MSGYIDYQCNAGRFPSLRSALTSHQLTVLRTWFPDTPRLRWTLGMAGELQDSHSPVDHIVAAALFEDTPAAQAAVNMLVAQSNDLDTAKITLSAQPYTGQPAGTFEELQCGVPQKCADFNGFVDDDPNTSGIYNTRAIAIYSTAERVVATCANADIRYVADQIASPNQCFPATIQGVSTCTIADMYNLRVVLQPSGKLVGNMNLATRKYTWYGAVYAAYNIPDTTSVSSDTVLEYTSVSQVTTVRNNLQEAHVPAAKLFTRLVVIQGVKKSTLIDQSRQTVDETIKAWATDFAAKHTSVNFTTMIVDIKAVLPDALTVGALDAMELAYTAMLHSNVWDWDVLRDRLQSLEVAIKYKTYEVELTYVSTDIGSGTLGNAIDLVIFQAYVTTFDGGNAVVNYVAEHLVDKRVAYVQRDVVPELWQVVDNQTTRVVPYTNRPGGDIFVKLPAFAAFKSQSRAARLIAFVFNIVLNVPFSAMQVHTIADKLWLTVATDALPTPLGATFRGLNAFIAGKTLPLSDNTTFSLDWRSTATAFLAWLQTNPANTAILFDDDIAPVLLETLNEYFRLPNIIYSASGLSTPENLSMYGFENYVKPYPTLQNSVVFPRPQWTLSIQY
jgi:hypothetical protein